MSKGRNAATKPSPEDAVRKVIAGQPGATTEGLAQSAGVARSTAGKVLARLADAGEVVRHAGGHEGRKRLPDRWTPKDVELPAAYARHVEAETSGAATEMPKRSARGSRSAGGKPSKALSKDAASARRAPSTPAGDEPASDSPADPAGTPDRLKAFGLDPLVIDYLERNSDSGPHGPSAVAKALSRSSGAVANCLKRLADSKKIRRVGDKPLRYDKLAA